MAGEIVSYDHLPSFYSDLFELGYEVVGEVDSRLETVADWKEPYRKGVVDQGRIAFTAAAARYDICFKTQFNACGLCSTAAKDNLSFSDGGLR